MKPCRHCINLNKDYLTGPCKSCKLANGSKEQWNFEPIQQQPAVRKLTIEEFKKWMNAVHNDTNYDIDYDLKRLRIGIKLGYIEPEPVKTFLQQAREKFLLVYQGRGMADGELETIKDLYEKAIEELKNEKTKTR